MRNAGLLLIVLALQSQTAPPNLDGVRTISAATPVDVQIAIAKEAGPPVSAAATIYVLGPHGYTQAQKGTNGFTCLISRNRLDVMSPECYDAAGAPTLQVLLFVEEERAQGIIEHDIQAAVQDRYKRGIFVAPSRPGIVYMLSSHNYLWDSDSQEIVHYPGHLMFYAPYLKATDVGSGPGAPGLTDPGQPDNLMVVIPASSHPH